MPVLYQSGFAPAPADMPLTHARIAHAGNWITGTASASSTDPAAIYDAGGPASDALFEAWRPATLPASWTLTGPAPTVLDYCAIGADNLHAEGIAFTIEADLGAGFVQVAGPFTATAPGPIFVMFAPVTATRARVVFASGQARPILGFVRFGRALQMPDRTRYAGRTPFDLARQVTTIGAQSVQGEPLARRIIRTGQKLAFSWAHLPEAFVTTYVADFLDALEGAPFVIAERPGTHPRDVALGWITGARPTPQAAGIEDLHGLQIQIEGYVNPRTPA